MYAIPLISLALAVAVGAHENGMDMSMDGPMALLEGHMLPYLHFAPGDVLWMRGWVPDSAGSIFGACVGIALLAAGSRWLAACRSLMNASARAVGDVRCPNDNGKGKDSDKAAEADGDDRSLATPSPTAESASAEPALPSLFRALQGAAPFAPAHDTARGVVYAAHSALHFTLMLAAMTFQVSFIVAICVGLGIGEAMFGRYAAHARLD